MNKGWVVRELNKRTPESSPAASYRALRDMIADIYEVAEWLGLETEPMSREAIESFITGRLT
jgi:hypothetical protein